MKFVREQQEAQHLLSSIEDGTQSISQLRHLIDDADPALIYLIVSWLRQRYGRDHPAAEGVIGRIVELTAVSTSMKTKMRQGQADSISKWFEDEHQYADFSAAEFIELIVEKLEG